MKKGWTYKKIGDVFRTYAGGTPSKSNKANYENGSIPWIRSGEVCQKYITESELCISEEGLKNSSAKYYPIDTVLVAMYGATAAQCGILKFEATSNQAVCGILPKEDFSPEFVYAYFTYIKDDLSAQAQGGAQPNISQEKIKKVLFPCIPLSEQHTIVSRLDAAFANIDALKANAEKQLSEARQLFQAELTECMRPKEGWEEKTLKEIGETQTGTTPPKSDPTNYGDFIPFIRPAELDIDSLGGINYDSEIKLSKKGIGKSRLIKANSILMCCIGSVGKMGYSMRDVTCNQQINTITPTSEFSPKFIYYAMHDNKFQEEVIKEAKSAQATLPIISKGKWEKHKICYPSLAIQQQIVFQLDSLSVKVRELEDVQLKTLAECDALKQAMLREVFE